MNFTSIMTVVGLITKYLPTIETVITEVTSSVKHTMPSDVTTNPNPTVPQYNPTETVKGLQRLLNDLVKPTPLLTVDGLYGPRTDKVLRDGLRKAGLNI